MRPALAAALLATLAAPADAASRLVAARRQPLAGRVLALAAAGEGRLAVLYDDSLALLRGDGATLATIALPGPRIAVRAPAGLLCGAEDGGSIWALTNGRARAVLFSLEGDHLVERLQADALPWPSVPTGLRYQRGTNVVEAAGDLWATADGELAVSPDGALWHSRRPTELRLGWALAALTPALAAASSPAPQGEADAVLLVDLAGPEPRVLEASPVEGTIRALAALRAGGALHLAAAIEDPAGGTTLVVWEVRQP